MFITLILLINFLAFSCQANPISKEDQIILSRFWKFAEKQQLQNKSHHERAIEIAKYFIGTPYKSNTLNSDNNEKLIVNLREFDCVTFVENVLALTFLPDYNDRSIDIFLKNLQKIRYRHGIIKDYTSRMHYSTDWLYEMQQNNVLYDITQKLGGIPFEKDICFMTQFSNKYKVLASNPSLVKEMKNIEKDINAREYFYLPKVNISKKYQQINSGDILLITTSIKNLDTSHIGIALKKGKDVYLLHASSTNKKVSITTLPLEEYMSNIKSQSGIIVARIIQN